MQTQIIQDNNADSEYPIEDRINGLIEQLSAYIEHYHRGWVEFISYENNVVKVRLGGACETCDLKPHTLHGWVEGTIRQFFPQVKRVEAID